MAFVREMQQPNTNTHVDVQHMTQLLAVLENDLGGRAFSRCRQNAMLRFMQRLTITAPHPAIKRFLAGFLDNEPEYQRKLAQFVSIKEPLARLTEDVLHRHFLNADVELKKI